MSWVSLEIWPGALIGWFVIVLDMSINDVKMPLEICGVELHINDHAN